MSKLQWMIVVVVFTRGSLISVTAVAQNATKLTPGPPPPTQNVLVVNTSAQPVPTTVQGTTTVNGTVGLAAGSTVNIGNAPTVTIGNTPSVTIANVPTVNLAGGGSVNVTNPLDSHGAPTPVAVLEATHPYEDSCYIMFNGASTGSCLFQTIPSGQRLVIREFDATGAMETGLQPTYFFLETGVSHFFPLTAIATNAGGYSYYTTHHETELYETGGNAPGCNIYLSGTSTGGNFRCSLSGYLLDLP